MRALLTLGGAPSRGIAAGSGTHTQQTRAITPQEGTKGRRPDRIPPEFGRQWSQAREIDVKLARPAALDGACSTVRGEPWKLQE